MELKDILTVFRRRYHIAIAVFVVVLGGSYYYHSGKVVTRFQASAHILVMADSLPLGAKEQEILKFAPQERLFMTTKEAILASTEIHKYSAAVYLAMKDVQRPRQFSWKDAFIEIQVEENKDNPDLSMWVVDRGEPGPIRIVATEIELQARVFEGAISAPQPVSAGPGNQLFRITATAASAELAVEYANAHAKAAMVYGRKESIEALNNVLKAYEGELQSRLNETEMQRALFGARGPDGVRSDQRLLAARQEDVLASERRINDLTDRHAKNVDAIKLISSDLAEQIGVAISAYPGESARLAAYTDEIITAMRSERIGLQIKAALKDQYWQAENPMLQEMLKRIQYLRTQERMTQREKAGLDIIHLTTENLGLDKDIEIQQQRGSGYRSEVNTLEPNLAKEIPKLKELERRERRLAETQDDVGRIATMIKAQTGFFRIEMQADPRKVSSQLTSWAQPMMMWLLISVVLGVSFAYGFEYADTRVHSDYDLRRYLNLPVLSIFDKLPRGESPLLMDMASQSPAAEMFHRAATILRTAMDEEKAKVLMVASAIPGEGKTTMATNIAVAYARKGLKTLLIDGDLRIPQIHKVFGVDNTHGLGDMAMDGGTPPEAALADRMRESGVPGLQVLVGGPKPAEPMALLESKAMIAVMQHLRVTFDMIVIDTPPITTFGDSLVLARLSDAVILVVAADKVDRQVVSWSKHLLGTVRAKVYGAVLNMARHSMSTQYYYYYHYQYGAKAVHERD